MRGRLWAYLFQAFIVFMLILTGASWAFYVVRDRLVAGERAQKDLKICEDELRLIFNGNDGSE